MTATDTAAQLRKAADHIRESGHAIGSYENSNGKLCLQGSLMKAVSPEAIQACDPAGTSEAMEALAALLPDTCNTSGCLIDDWLSDWAQVYHFNDYHCDGGKDAILLLEQAAEKLEAEL